MVLCREGKDENDAKTVQDEHHDIRVQQYRGERRVQSIVCEQGRRLVQHVLLREVIKAWNVAQHVNDHREEQVELYIGR